MKKLLAYVVGIGAAVYAVLCGLVLFVPQMLFYAPSNIVSDIETAKESGLNVEQIEYKSEDGTKLWAWYIKPSNGNDKVVVFMHGNAHNIEGFFHKLVPFARKGYGIFLPEYRGFGGLDGEINQKNLEADALAATTELQKLGYKNKDIIIYGMSLGSHTAVHTAYVLQKENPVAAVVLEVPFDSLANVVQDKVKVPMPLKFLMKEHYYDNLELISQIKSPVMIMGGNKDELVPVKLAKNLYQFAQEPKKMIIYPYAGHNDLYRFRNYNDIISWLEENEKGLK